MKPLIKWPGGKGRELDQVLGLIPEFDRYLEPFFGGGAMFFHLQPERAAINDTAHDLMEFYHLIRTSNQEFQDCVLAYAESFQGLLELGRGHVTELLSIFDALSDETAARQALTALLDRWQEPILSLFRAPIVRDAAALRLELEHALWDKLLRTRRNHQKRPFSPDDLAENLVTGLASGYYLYFRSVYNDWNLGRASLSPAQRSANFFFIRENCYGSMFRYNRHGEFNIPYGGMSYNSKDFAAKAAALFAPETARLFARTQLYCRDFEEFLEQTRPTKRDFLFLDPPYDTEFSDYEGNCFTKLDQARLAVALSRTPAKFLLIIKSTPFIEDLYSRGFYVRRFDKHYTYNVRSRNDRQAEHLIVTNYPTDELGGTI